MTTPDPPTRSALLARLPAVGFVPPADAAPWSVAARSAAFAGEVEAFAVVYWSLPPAERRERFRGLWDARYGPAAGRLAELEAGLDVVPSPAINPWVEDVTRRARELFVLPPRERAARRAAALGPNFQPGVWAEAARKWLRLLPEFTLLEPQLYDRFVGGWGPIPVPDRKPVARANAIARLSDRERDRRDDALAYGVGCLGLPLVLAALAVLRSLLG